MSREETLQEDRKESILHAATQIFARYGYTKTTLDDIASVLSIKKNSLYYYFPSKEAIFNAVVEKEANSFWNEIKPIINKKNSAEEKLRSFVVEGRNYVRGKINLHDLASEVFLDVKRALSDTKLGFYNRELKELSLIIDEGIKNGEFKKVNSKEIAGCLINLFSSVEHREIEKSKKEFLSEVNFELIDNTTLPLFNLIVEGLKAK